MSTKKNSNDTTSEKVQTTRKRVGKYELGRTLGEGSFAKVKFAKNVETGECVAIKILDRDQVLRNKNPIAQIQPSSFGLRVILVTALGYGKQDKDLYRDRATRGRLKEDEARSYFQQLINAVDFCHGTDVFHRDLKHENLLLDPNGVLKISDFGLSVFSQQVREDGLLHTACGTPNYVAPEVLKDQGYDVRASDIWSCGVIVFVLMAGYLPFDEPKLICLYKKITKADFTCPYFTTGARKLLQHILDPDPLTENLVTERKVRPVSMNAFVLISSSQSFSLDNLSEKQMSESERQGLAKRETSFVSQCPPNEIISKIEEAAKPLGFNVDKRNYKMKLKGDKRGRKGQLSVATEVFEVAPFVHMVEFRKTGADTLEFHKFYKNFSSGLNDIIWKTDGIAEEKEKYVTIKSI
ncbi:CBL-interacting serine/threonine-protein kinase 9-like [Hibiscus syriacus]|uniref:CBL-interacting serine/threonine-protein kinase 9-like n=1 Tax=Hibiscus syriacus TaxID=106335 RepID=UPI0019204D1F|nr:CBL-interacting serine/threonine-protein kinase 9-like [Hibiscus syriacus]